MFTVVIMNAPPLPSVRRTLSDVLSLSLSGACQEDVVLYTTEMNMELRDKRQETSFTFSPCDPECVDDRSCSALYFCMFTVFVVQCARIWIVFSNCSLLREQSCIHMRIRITKKKNKTRQ